LKEPVAGPEAGEKEVGKSRMGSGYTHLE
jgi:hypothetical protein